MNRSAVAALWRDISKSEPGPLLRASGKLLNRDHGYDRLPQPGFVGQRYREGGLLVLGLNPAAGSEGMSGGDIMQYELLNALSGASNDGLVSAFESLMNHLAAFMPSWNIIRNNGVDAILNSHAMSFEDVPILTYASGGPSTRNCPRAR